MKNARIVQNVLEVTLRVAVDLVIVHVAMLGALLLAALRPEGSSLQHVSTLMTFLRTYYLTTFVPLTVLFPAVYAMAGLYTKESRAGSISLKLRRAAIAAAVASAAIFAATLFLFRGEPFPPKLAAVSFTLLVLVAAPGVRLLKHWVLENEGGLRNGVGEGGPETILVVGGAGYIGSILVRKLLRKGHRVRVLDSLVYGASAIEDTFDDPRLEFIEGDCRNIRDVVGAMTGVKSVVHLAAIVGDPACDRDHQTALEINYAATRMMVEIAKGEGVKRFVFASSCSVYGASDEVMTEESEVGPISLYAETKVDSESTLLEAASDRFHPTILRFSTIFGLSPRPRFDLVVNLLTAKAIKEGVVTIFNGEQWRPFLHVADAAESVIRVLEAPVEVVGGQIYNVGDDRLNHTLTDVADKIVDLFPGVSVEETSNADRRNYRVSFCKIKGQLGFTCSKSLEDGIKELKLAFENGLIMDYHSPLYSNVKFLQQYGSPVQKDEIGVQVMAALAQRAIPSVFARVF